MTSLYNSAKFLNDNENKFGGLPMPAKKSEETSPEEVDALKLQLLKVIGESHKGTEIEVSDTISIPEVVTEKQMLYRHEFCAGIFYLNPELKYSADQLARLFASYSAWRGGNHKYNPTGIGGDCRNELIRNPARKLIKQISRRPALWIADKTTARYKNFEKNEKFILDEIREFFKYLGL